MLLKSRKMSWNVSSSPNTTHVITKAHVLSSIECWLWAVLWSGACCVTQCSKHALWVSHLFVHPSHSKPDQLKHPQPIHLINKPWSTHLINKSQSIHLRNTCDDSQGNDVSVCRFHGDGQWVLAPLVCCILIGSSLQEQTHLSGPTNRSSLNTHTCLDQPIGAH